MRSKEARNLNYQHPCLSVKIALAHGRGNGKQNELKKNWSELQHRIIQALVERFGKTRLISRRGRVDYKI